MRSRVWVKHSVSTPPPPPHGANHHAYHDQQGTKALERCAALHLWLQTCVVYTRRHAATPECLHEVAIKLFTFQQSLNYLNQIHELNAMVEDLPRCPNAQWNRLNAEKLQRYDSKPKMKKCAPALVFT